MFGERLRNLLDQYELSPAQFADAMGVNRSAISHVLNNRNNPGYDFIQKMHTAFPEWDFDWLLFGKKTTRKAQSAVSSEAYERPKPQAQLPPQQTQAPPAEPKERMENKQYAQGSLFDDRGEPPARNIGATRMNRMVTKTILIYSDGTFEIFQNNFK